MKVFLIIECTTCNTKKEVELPFKLSSYLSLCKEAEVIGVRLIEESENEMKNAERVKIGENGEKN